MLLFAQLLKLLLPFLWPHKILNLHLTTFAIAQNKVTRRNLVSERLPLLRNPERQVRINRIDDILIIRENPLRSLRPEIRNRRIVHYRTDMSLEHHIKLLNLVPVFLPTSRTLHVRLQKLFRRNTLSCPLDQLVRAKTSMTFLTFD